MSEKNRGVVVDVYGRKWEVAFKSDDWVTVHYREYDSYFALPYDKIVEWRREDTLKGAELADAVANRIDGDLEAMEMVRKYIDLAIPREECTPSEEAAFGMADCVIKPPTCPWHFVRSKDGDGE